VVATRGEIRLFGVDPRAYDVMSRYPSLAVQRCTPEDRGTYLVVSLIVNK
jgi:hypothetical protein